MRELSRLTEHGGGGDIFGGGRAASVASGSEGADGAQLLHMGAPGTAVGGSAGGSAIEAGGEGPIAPPLSPARMQEVARLEEELRRLKQGASLTKSVPSAPATEPLNAPPSSSTSSWLAATEPPAAATSLAVRPAAGLMTHPPDQPQQALAADLASLAAQVGDALRADLVSEVKRDLAAELRSQVQQMQASLMEVLKPAAVASAASTTTATSAASASTSASTFAVTPAAPTTTTPAAPAPRIRR